jgi:hypothetical protein
VPIDRRPGRRFAGAAPEPDGASPIILIDPDLAAALMRARFWPRLTSHQQAHLLALLGDGNPNAVLDSLEGMLSPPGMPPGRIWILGFPAADRRGARP